MGQARQRKEEIQELKARGPRPKPHERFIADLTLELHNGHLSDWDVTVKCLQLGNYKEFGLIVPRKFTKNIVAPFDMEEIDLDNLEEPVLSIYRDSDTVMVKNKLIQ
jgi:hypothetical protein